MKRALYICALLALAVFSTSALAAVPPGNGPGTYDVLHHSSCCLQGESPIAADVDLWHAHFEGPGTIGTSPGITFLDTTDLTNLADFDMLYIATDQADNLGSGDWASIRSWVSGGGVLAINNHEGSDGGFSEFGASFGASYEFTAVGASESDLMTVIDPNDPIINSPNVLRDYELENWGSSTHGAFESVGPAYNCSVESEDGDIALCTAAYGNGVIILTAFDPECGDGCHDDHVNNPGSQGYGSEMWENFMMARGQGAATSVPATSREGLLLMIVLMLGLGAYVVRRIS